MKVCDKTCIFCFFPIINKYLCMAKRSLLSRCPSYEVLALICNNGFPLHCCKASKYFVLLSTIQTYLDFQVKNPKFLPDYNQIWTFSTYFREVPNIKFHENLLSSSHLDTCRQTDGRTGGHEEANRRFSRLMRTRLKMQEFLDLLRNY